MFDEVLLVMVIQSIELMVIMKSVEEKINCEEFDKKDIKLYYAKKP